MPSEPRDSDEAQGVGPHPESAAFGEDAPPSHGDRDSDTVTLSWRKKAFQWILWILLFTGSTQLLLVFLLTPEVAPLRNRLAVVAMFGILVAVALVRGAPHRIRVWVMLAAGYGAAFVMLSSTGLLGGGRTLLLTIAIYALVFAGRRSGWVAAGISLLVFAIGAAIYMQAGSDPSLQGQEGLVSIKYWLFQGTMLSFSLGTVLFLVASLVNVLGEALTTEREAARERDRLERLLLETAARERRDVGHQLHDGPCQQITAALLRCKVAQRSLASGSVEGQEGHLEAIAELLDTSVGEIHDLAKGMSPPGFSPESLPAALAELVRGARAAGVAACDFSLQGTAPTCSRFVADHLFRIAQEAVGNALRHSMARRIQVRLRAHGGALVLQILDDGAGISRDANRGRMGMRIMRHRAELAGGSLSVGPAEGGGTTVTCTVPLRGGGP